MENFTHCGKEVEFWQVTGEVLGSNKYSETHVSVSSSGGGAMSARMVVMSVHLVFIQLRQR